MIPIHPLNKLSNEFVYEFAKKIIAKKAVGINELEGKIYEQFLCEIYGVEWKGSNTGLTDVVVGDGQIGYSVKSLRFDRKGFPNVSKDQRVSTIVGRNSPDTHDGSHIEKNITPADKAGEIVAGIWNSRLSDAVKSCEEFRQLTILKSSCLHKWLLFEFIPQFYNYKDFAWKWEKGKGKGKKTINLYGVNDKFRLTWQPNGSQFTLNQQIPHNHVRFILKDIPIISEDQILKQIGSDKSWISVEKINGEETQKKEVLENCEGNQSKQTQV